MKCHYLFHVLFNECEKENEDIVKCLVEHGVDVNKENKYGETPLVNAFKIGNEDIVKYLVENGTELNKKRIRLK